MKKLDEFHYHEMLDRLHCLNNIIASIIMEHPVYKNHKKLRKLIDDASYMIGEGYQLTAGISDKKFDTIKSEIQE